MDVSASNICLFVNFIALLLEPDIRDDKTATTFNLLVWAIATRGINESLHYYFCFNVHREIKSTGAAVNIGC